jgi:hypothetical protein
VDGHNLTDQQKVEFVLKYIPPSHKDLWKSLKGYATGDWTTFRGELEKLYPNMDTAARYSRQALYNLVNMSARTRMRDEKDVFNYYQRFLAISNPLHSNGQISSDERNSEFFQGFNSYDQTSIANRLYPLHPNRPHNKPYDYKDVFSVAQGYFADLQFYRPDNAPPVAPSRWPQHPPEEDRPTRWYEPEPTYHQHDNDFPRDHTQRDQRDRDFPRDTRCDHKPLRDSTSQRQWDYLRNPPRNLRDQFYTHPKAPKYEYETKSVRFANQIPTKANAHDDNNLEDMVLKIHNLSVHEPAYAALYAQICHHFPNAAKPLPLPDFGQTTAVAYQSPANQASASPHQPHTHHSLTNKAASFFGKTPRTDGCAFCALQGHLIKRCPAAEEYVRSGRVTVGRP